MKLIVRVRDLRDEDLITLVVLTSQGPHCLGLLLIPLPPRLRERERNHFSISFSSPQPARLVLISCRWHIRFAGVLNWRLTQLRSRQTMKSHHWERCRDSKEDSHRSSSSTPPSLSSSLLHLHHHSSYMGRSFQHIRHIKVSLWFPEDENRREGEGGNRKQG